MSHPLTTAEISHQGAHLLQDWIMNDTSLSLPAIVQCEGMYDSELFCLPDTDASSR